MRSLVMLGTSLICLGMACHRQQHVDIRVFNDSGQSIDSLAIHLFAKRYMSGALPVDGQARISVPLPDSTGTGAAWMIIYTRDSVYQSDSFGYYEHRSDVPREWRVSLGPGMRLQEKPSASLP